MKKPFLSLICALCCLAGLLGVSGLVGDYQQELSRARTQVDLAIKQSEERLVDRTRLASQNSIFVKNLDWGLTHTINQSLAGYLEPTVIDEVHLHDANCQVRAQAILGASAGIDCPLRILSERQWDEPYWFASNGQANIAWTTRVNVGNQGIFYLTSLVKLNQDWLTNRAQLTSLVERLELALVPASQVGNSFMLKKFGDYGQFSGAALVSQEKKIIWLPSLFSGEKTDLRTYTWILWLVAIFSALYIWYQQNLSLGRSLVEKDSTVEWSRKILSSCRSEVQSIPEIGIENEELQSALQKVGEKVVALHNKLAEARTEIQALTLKLSDRDEELTELHGQLSDLAELESFAIQFRGTSSRFMGRMEDLASTVDDSITNLSQNIGGHARNLRAFLHGWQQQIDARGARRFFRYLAETTSDSGQSELDNQLQRMSQICLQLLRETEQLLSKNQSIKESAQSALLLGSHWHGLALREVDSPRINNLLEPALTAQDLYRASESSGSLSFVNVMGLVYQGDLPQIPKVVLASAIYHLFESISDHLGTAYEGVPLVRVEVIRKGSCDYLFLGTNDVASFDPISPALMADAHHLKVAKQLLSPFQVQVHAYKSVSSEIVFGIHWATTNEDVELGGLGNQDARSADTRSV